MKQAFFILFFCTTIFGYHSSFGQKKNKSPFILYNSISAGVNLSSLSTNLSFLSTNLSFLSTITPSVRANLNRVGLELNLPVGKTEVEESYRSGYFYKIDDYKGGVSVFWFVTQSDWAHFFVQASTALNYVEIEKHYRQFYGNGNYADVQEHVRKEKFSGGLLFGAEKVIKNNFKLKLSGGYAGYHINQKNSTYFLCAELGLYFIVK